MSGKAHFLTRFAYLSIIVVPLYQAVEINKALAADEPAAVTQNADPATPSPESAPATAEPAPIEAESEAEPRPEETHYVLGVTRLNAGDLIGATEELREALRVQPEFGDARMSLGTALYQIGDLDSAIEAYQAALRTQPDLVQAHVNLATVYMVKREWASARNELQAALQLQPDLVRAHYALGVVRYGLGDRRGAIEAYRAALQLKPDYADAHYNLGLLLKLANQEGDAAQEFYAAALAGMPKAQYFLGSAHASGRGVERDLVVAVQWWFRAAEQHEPQAMEALSQLRQSVFTKNKRPAGERDAIIQAFAEFRSELWKEYPEFDRQASDCVGAALIQQDRLREALPVLLQEAMALSEPAQAVLETLYQRGVEGELAPYDERIRTFFKMTAEEGVPRPRLVMARVYAHGLGVQQDVKKAKALLKGESSDEAKALLRDISALQQNHQSSGKSKSASNASP
ncbi:MAG: tetratricopeptide repeat protein [Nitrospirales bacterium]